MNILGLGIGRGVVPAVVVIAAALSLQGCDKPKPGAGGATSTLSPTQICLQTTDPTPVGVGSCREAVREAPNDAPIRRRMALLWLKKGQLPSARQAYQIAQSYDPKDAEATFGLGLTLEAIGEPGANLKKVEAVRRDPAVVDRFRKYGFAEPDLMIYDTAPEIVRAPGFGVIKPMIPTAPLARSLGVDVKCLVGTTGHIHDCNVITPLTADQLVYGEAAKRIVALTTVNPAKDKGAPVADAPILLTMVFDAKR